jgi:glutamate racemase
LRARSTLPIVAMEPAVKPAAARTRTGTVGVLATTRTLASRKFADLVRAYGSGVKVLAQPCPGLVEQVEAGDFQSDETRALVAGYLRPLIAQGADTIVLGCTHYSFLAPLIADVAGSGVTLIDPAPAIVAELARRLTVLELCAPATRTGSDRFWTTGDIPRVSAVITRLWPAPVLVLPLPGQGKR